MSKTKDWNDFGQQRYFKIFYIFTPLFEYSKKLKWECPFALSFKK